MASRISALNHYRPQIKYGETVQRRELIEYLVLSTGLTGGDVVGVLAALSEAVAHFNSHGRGVKLDGLGTYLPNVNYRGEFDVAHRLDKELKRDLKSGGSNVPLINRKSIGKSADQIIARWNAEHPDDPVK